MRIKSETIKAKVYPLMQAAVEAGIVCGWHRAHKHTDTPEPEAIKEAIEQAVMHEIAERFSFDDDYEQFDRSDDTWQVIRGFSPH